MLIIAHDVLIMIIYFDYKNTNVISAQFYLEFGGGLFVNFSLNTLISDPDTQADISNIILNTN